MQNIITSLIAIADTGDQKRIRELASAYEDLCLAYEEFPDTAIDVITQILSEKTLFQKQGIEQFLSKTSTDMYRLNPNQKQWLLDTIVKHYSEYADIKLCWWLGDIIARGYDQKTALQTFAIIFNTASDQGKEGIALGLDVLTKQPEANDALLKSIKDIFKRPFA
jgi:hypothetical protein